MRGTMSRKADAGGIGDGDFQSAVRGVLDRGGIKGYNDALRHICRNLPHALGEIIYKAVRYHHKRDPEDLVKIAAWAELVWREHVDRRGCTLGDTARKELARVFPQGPLKGTFAHVRGSRGSGEGVGEPNSYAKAARKKAGKGRGTT